MPDPDRPDDAPYETPAARFERFLDNVEADYRMADERHAAEDAARAERRSRVMIRIALVATGLGTLGSLVIAGRGMGWW